MLTSTGGLDLGPPSDFTAFALVEHSAGTPGQPSQFAVRHLVRWSPGTPYQAIVLAVAETMALIHERASRARIERELAERGRLGPSRPSLPRPRLALDQTAVGKPIVALFDQEAVKADPVPITLTGGQDAMRDYPGWRVPKLALLSTLQVLLQTRRLQVAQALPEASTLAKELLAYRPKVTLSTVDETAWREGARDDLLFAVGLAVWLAEAPRDGFYQASYYHTDEPDRPRRDMRHGFRQR